MNHIIEKILLEGIYEKKKKEIDQNGEPYSDLYIYMLQYMQEEGLPPNYIDWALDLMYDAQEYGSFDDEAYGAWKPREKLVEDFVEAIKKFHIFKKQNRIKKKGNDKNLDKYPNLYDFIDFVKNVESQGSYRENQKKYIKIYDQDDIQIIIPLTWESACHMGRKIGATWCVATSNTSYFEEDYKNSIFVFVHDPELKIIEKLFPDMDKWKLEDSFSTVLIDISRYDYPIYIRNIADALNSERGSDDENMPTKYFEALPEEAKRKIKLYVQFVNQDSSDHDESSDLPPPLSSR